MYGQTRLKPSNVSISNGNIKYPIIKSIFAVNLQLKREREKKELFLATVANVDIWSLKSLHISYDKNLDHMLVKFEQNCIGPNYTKFWAFWQKTSFLKPIFDKALTIGPVA